MSPTIGFIGIGVMGRAMSQNLLRAGFPVIVYDVAAAAMELLKAAGARRGASPREVAAGSDVVITMLPDHGDVEGVLMGGDGILEGARAGATVIDMSSVPPMASKRFCAACGEKGVSFLDAPVSGGEPKAIDGTLAIMAGGDEQVFRNVLPVLQAMGSTVTLTGPVGAGNVTKLANQIMVAGNMAAMGEALVLATKAGVDPEVVFQAVRGGLAGSTVLDAKAPMVCSRNFQPGARMWLHYKDLRNALATADALNVPLPLTAAIEAMMVSLLNHGKGDLDHSALVQFAEEMAQVVVSSETAAASLGSGK